MTQDESLRDAIREFIAALGAYLRQNAADAVNEALTTPIKRAARKAAFLGMGCGLAAMAAVCLALAFFTVLVELFEAKSAAYGITCIVCLLVGALCLWVVFKDGKKRGRHDAGARDQRRPGRALDDSSAETD